MKKFLTVFISSALILTSIAGTAVVSAETTNISSETSQKEYKAKMHNSSIGKVVAVDENKITILKAAMPEKENLKDDLNRPERSTDNAMPDFGDDSERPEPPVDGEKPEKAFNGKNKMQELSFSDTETTITINSNIEIYKITGLGRHKSEEESKEETREKINISEISPDNMINVIYDEDGTTVKAILLMDMPENISK